MTVAVLPLPPESRYEPLPAKELEVITQTGKQSAGGQNVNKVASAVRMKHKPTGLAVFVNGRDQVKNRAEALRLLTAKVSGARERREREAYAGEKSAQLGDRGRGDKLRTYNFIDHRVTDHRTGRETRNVAAVMKGEFGLLR